MRQKQRWINFVILFNFLFYLIDEIKFNCCNILNFSFEEFKLMVKHFFKMSDDDDIREDFERIDKNNDGSISLEGN